jgi:benzodiazapine receptor
LTKLVDSLLRFGNIAAFIITLVVNGLANTTLLNNRTTAHVSDLYPTLITPAGYVFAIWGVIYVLLAAFVVYQALPSQKNKPYQKQVSILFILSSLFNTLWLFLWQYDYITVSVILMFALLATLIAIYVRLNIGQSNAPLTEKLFIHLPFSVYLGWITIAAIANVAAALVSVNWNGLGISAEAWAVIVLIVALAITLAVIVTRRDISYSLVIVWALVGIAIKQNASPNIVLTAEIAIIILLVALVLATAFHTIKDRQKAV